MRSPTPRQKEIHAFIAGYIDDNDGRSPSLQEIADKFEFHYTAAQQHIAAMVKKKMVSKVAGVHRSLRPL